MVLFRWGLLLGLPFVLGLSCARNQAVSPQGLAQESACVQSLQAGDYNGAKTRCELCLEYDDQIPECLNGLGLVAFSQGDTNTAIDKFTQAIQISPNFAQARNNLGAIFFQQGQYNQAIPYFQASLVLDPGYEDARYNLGLSYLRLGQAATAQKDTSGARSYYAQAQDQYEKLIAVDANYANAYRDMGLMKTYLAALESSQSNIKADLNSADKYFSQCLEVDPSNETCLESYGHTLLYQGQYDQALFEFVQCLTQNSKNTTCSKGLSAAYQGSHMKTSSSSQYIQMLEANPNNANGHYGYCVALFQAAMNDQAISECETAIKLDAKLCNAYYQLGMYYKKALNSAESLANCNSYISCDQTQSVPAQVASCQKVVSALSQESNP